MIDKTLVQKSPDNGFELMHCNYRAVKWLMDHQAGIWRSGFNGVESLDYGQIQSAMGFEGIKPKRQQKLYGQFLHIERGFISTVNQERKKNKNRA